MLNLKFNTLKLEGFQSLAKAELNFKDLGTCFIKGINNYDEKTKSNGSGKSSLMSSIIWCLFGRTPSGISNEVVNKFYDRGCYVKLDINVDGTPYMIRRSIKHKEYKTNLVILKESIDISGRNKTDSNKLIKDILKIDEELFLQMIFLSQGFSNRFAIYSPKDRKDLLEAMYGLDEKLNTFIENLKVKSTVIDSEYAELNNNMTKLKTTIENDVSQIRWMCTNISTKKSEIEKLSNTKVNITDEDVESIKNELIDIGNQQTTLRNKINDKNNEINELRSEINSINALISNKQSEISKFSNNKVCPTCGTLLEDYNNNEHIQIHLKELNEEINELYEKVSNLNNDLKAKRDTEYKMQNKMETLDVKISELSSKLDEYTKVLNEEKIKDATIDSISKTISDLETQVTTLTDNMNKCEDELKTTEVNKENKHQESIVIQHAIRLANNQFKAYLLENILSLLNNKLNELSTSLFENEIISITGDSKLDILLGDKMYEQLSGGEQRKVDIAIIIAQRYLAQQMNSLSSNIIILDEIFDGLDDISFNVVLDLLSDEIQDVETTFIISHRDVKEIPFDSVITVTKNKNQLSEIELF